MQPASTAPHFHTPAGLIIGRVDGPVVRATGIRYALAARFCPPESQPPATVPIYATAPAPACPQLADPRVDQVLGELFAALRFDEDCLRLSITRPADYRAGETLPVIVWVHGGSYVSGAGDLAIYDPAVWVAEQRVVFVAVTYRLGLFGFLGSGSTPPNLGLLDLLEALRWVQRNIAAFGGDPALVTMFGHSSGADAIAQLMLVPGAPGLFRRVMLHSAPLGLTRGRQRMLRAMSRAVGEIPTTASTDEVLARESAVVKAARWQGLKSGMPFGPQYGAAPLPPETEIEASWAAVAPHIDVLIGATAEETRFFAVIDPTFNWLQRLPLAGGRLVRLLTETTSCRIYLDPARAFAEQQVRAGGRAYRFLLTYQPPGSPFGAAHVVDLPLLLGTQASWAATPLLGQANWEEFDAAGRQVRQLWADFARTGIMPAKIMIPGVLEVAQT
ncbi:carboxylesterase/lipase family protein [Microvirga sp. STS02]|uniref:carboxylesterase family protein n=1 Tax=Hymenobacter negativus TaxID=2795026 RepID=UPI0018DE579B|nr:MULTISPECIES: carboxylesterase family protein [Bacteria]MBH8570938.1 carboxylesterase/lipase family protein [Hymenobacter negativus]MBR7210676.1 carboxylesterase/lipase family protein [Microvirga sp. STS02]